MNTLSVFFPTYNEEENIAATVERAIDVLVRLNVPWEVLIVNDGSTDDTARIADDLAARHEHVRVLHQPNGGYGAAVRAGLYGTRLEWVAFTDADGQFDVSEIAKFIEVSDRADVIFGYRIARQDPFPRSLFAKGWSLSLRMALGLKLRDVNCGFKMMNRSVLNTIPPLEARRGGGMINAELAVNAARCGFRLMEVGVHHYPRRAGRPTGANLGVIVRSYLDLARFCLRSRTVPSQRQADRVAADREV